ncbi:hypothetical protein NC653_007848 [Populus alba x Populus x berolinensis]|uniref:Pectinesterase n=1 Tax=Populus alba x Populus x berolinensis TaxID=444605 RepID=A0AAD6R500_9ROSI|nr:hypothetical protein NC653_007848 [Populus alba x Populus x berolinensis]
MAVGKYRTVSAAVADAPKHSAKRYIIKIKAGVYRKMWKFQVRKPTSCFLEMEGKKLSSHQVGMWLMAAQTTILPLLRSTNVAWWPTKTPSMSTQTVSSSQTCYIAGTVDFIFGNSAAVFQDCDIRARRPNPGQTITITAQGRSDPNQKTGIVIQKSRIGATPDLQHARSNFSAYLEYENSGAGAGTAGRVPWNGYKVITDATEAQAFTARNFNHW